MPASGGGYAGRPGRQAFPRAGASRSSRACPSLRTEQPPRHREIRACSQRVSSRAQLTKQAGFETTTSPVCTGALSCVEVTRAFTTPETLVLGTSGWRFSVRCVKTPACCLRRNSRFHHSTTSCGGNKRHEYFPMRSEEHTSELQSHSELVCRLL